ncbi:hypothetical protein EAF04_005242 [Stromatinia cepivora]|nr:hypothetical protein EAF04_005242 [Stromatinia cepivora]
MITNIRLFLFRRCFSLPILRNGPISSPMSSSSIMDYTILGLKDFSGALYRTINENVPIQHTTYGPYKETFVIEIYEKEGEKSEDFQFFLPAFFEQHGGPSSKDAVLIWGFEEELSDKIYNMVIEHSSPPTLIWMSTDTILSTCNKCARLHCRHIQYEYKFLLMYWELLRSVRENVGLQLGILDVPKWKTQDQEKEMEKNAGIFGVTIKAFRKLFGAASGAAFAFV